jgi:pimeloyl-ACP methyl ester carboxylesterase
MRLYQRIVRELKVGALQQTPGEILHPPAILPCIEIEGRRLSYAPMGLAKAGRTSPVVFVHGFGGFFLDWVKVMANVGQATDCYAIDLPGWGFSEANPHATGIEDDAEAVSAFIEALGLKDVILCGLSYGAGVAWAAAALRIPNVRHVVLLNPMPPRPLDFMRSPLYRGLFTLNTSLSATVWGHRFFNRMMYEAICKETLLEGHRLDEFYLDLGFRAIKQPGIALILYAQAKGARETDWVEWERRLARVRVPVTILQSPEDKIFPMESARHLQSLIPGAALVEVQGSGHAMVFDQHRKVSDFVCTLLEGSEIPAVSGID